MSRGLGKIERWILTAAYNKTVKRKLPVDWLQLKDERLEKCLYRSEILLNCFKLERSESLLYEGYPGECLRYPQCFKTTNKSKAAYVSCRRATKSLKAKGYIEMAITQRMVCPGPQKFEVVEYSWTFLILTKAGRTKAKELLSVNSRHHGHTVNT